MQVAFFSKIYTQTGSDHEKATYLTGVDNLALYASDLVLSLHVVPELGPGEDGVTGEETHSEELWVSLLFGWEGSADNVELSNLKMSQNCYDTACGCKND